MSNPTGSTKSTGIILGASVLLLAILLYFAFGREDQKGGVPEPTTSAARSTAPPQAGEVPTSKPSKERVPAPTNSAAPDRRSEIGRVVAADEAASPDDEARYLLENAEEVPESRLREVDAAENRQIPAHIADAFDEPYAEISEADMALIEANRNPVLPEHIRQQIEEAETREMPADVQAAFDDPYVEASEEEWQAIRDLERAGHQ